MEVRRYLSTCVSQTKLGNLSLEMQNIMKSETDWFVSGEIESLISVL